MNKHPVLQPLQDAVMAHLTASTYSRLLLTAPMGSGLDELMANVVTEAGLYGGPPGRGTVVIVVPLVLFGQHSQRAAIKGNPRVKLMTPQEVGKNGLPKADHYMLRISTYGAKFHSALMRALREHGVSSNWIVRDDTAGYKFGRTAAGLGFQTYMMSSDGAVNGR